MTTKSIAIGLIAGGCVIVAVGLPMAFQGSLIAGICTVVAAGCVLVNVMHL